MMHGAGFAWPFLILVPIFWVLVIGLIVTLIVTLVRRRRTAGGPPWAGGPQGTPPWSQAAADPTRAAEVTLAERFARGDIDEVEYRARLEVLRANRIAPPAGPQIAPPAAPPQQ